MENGWFALVFLPYLDICDTSGNRLFQDANHPFLDDNSETIAHSLIKSV